MIKKIILTTVSVYTFGILAAWALDASSICKGWAQCEEEVYCPNGYAVYVPEQKAYLPCEKFEKYADGYDKSVLVK